jgi:hypothetical protein
MRSGTRRSCRRAAGRRIRVARTARAARPVLCLYSSDRAGRRGSFAREVHTMSVQPGDRAPAFSVAGANREGMIALAEYAGSPVLVALFRGLY